MKIRAGYVSNSSSSSFVLIGRVVGNVFRDKAVRMTRGKRHYMIGRSLYEGVDVMSLDSGMIKWIKDHKGKDGYAKLDWFKGDVIECAAYVEADESPAPMPHYEHSDDLLVWTGNADYCSSHNKDLLERNYADFPRFGDNNNNDDEED